MILISMRRIIGLFPVKLPLWCKLFVCPSMSRIIGLFPVKLPLWCQFNRNKPMILLIEGHTLIIYTTEAV
jgi:hypothetical protein